MPAAAPLERPLLLYDGECSFCRLWIARWRHVIGDRIDVAPYQEAGARFPDIAADQYARALHLVEPDGTIRRGAEAVFRSLAQAPGHGWALWLYRFLPGFAPLSEWGYRLVAAKRPAFERITLLLWGGHLVPPGETLTVWIFLRVLGLTYLVAFVSLWPQILALAGSQGILPIQQGLESFRQHTGPLRYWIVPTLAWLDAGDGALRFFCGAGIGLSGLVVLGVAPAASLAGCWLLYLSLVTVGQDFMSFQWDALLLETGFLAIFLAPWRRWSRPGTDPPPPRLALWMLRWLLFRLMFSSAMVKFTGGDPVWRDLTALQYHYETQCLPPWTAWYFHHLPPWFQKLSAVVMYVIEGLVPFLIVAPRRLRFAAAAAMVGLQLLIVVTGNYGFFNLLALALCLLLLDDAVWPSRLRASSVAEAPAPWGTPWGPWPVFLMRPIMIALLILSVVPVLDAMRVPTGWMGPIPAAFRLAWPIRVVNHYGLFADMTTRRLEIVLEGSDDGAQWRAYEFRWKPGDVTRRPGFMAPHMPRLDWLMWFAALRDFREMPWFLRFCERVLQGSPPVLRLLAVDPFPGHPPRYLRAVVYDYHFSDAATRRATGAWWRREPLGLYCPVLTLEGGQLRAAEPPEAQR